MEPPKEAPTEDEKGKEAGGDKAADQQGGAPIKAESGQDDVNTVRGDCNGQRRQHCQW